MDMIETKISLGDTRKRKASATGFLAEEDGVTSPGGRRKKQKTVAHDDSDHEDGARAVRVRNGVVLPLISLKFFVGYSTALLIRFSWRAESSHASDLKDIMASVVKICTFGS